jgi:hypothetical protein
MPKSILLAIALEVGRHEAEAVLNLLGARLSNEKIRHSTALLTL